MVARAWVAAVAALGMAAPAASAQTVAAEAAYHVLSIGDGSLTEFVLPIGLSWRAGSVRFDANTAFATAKYEQDGVTSELSGPTDLTVRMLVPFSDDRGRIIIAANVPTGRKSLEPEELPVAAVLTTDLLGMPVRSFGSGAAVTTGFAFARPAGSLVLGGIALFRAGSAYEPVVAPVDGEPTEFRPGSEVRLRLAVERPAVSGPSWRLAGSWSRYGDDQANDREVFSRGDRLLGEASVEFPFLTGAASLYGWSLYRAGSQLLAGTEVQPTPASSLSTAGAQVAYPLTAALTLRPRAELTLQSGDPGFGGGSGYLTRVGSSATYRVGRIRLEPALLLQLGSLESRSISGIVIRGGVLW